jgi:hypothetical protein
MVAENQDNEREFIQGKNVNNNASSVAGAASDREEDQSEKLDSLFIAYKKFHTMFIM